MDANLASLIERHDFSPFRNSPARAEIQRKPTVRLLRGPRFCRRVDGNRRLLRRGAHRDVCF
jgi:hypothetical protein